MQNQVSAEKWHLLKTTSATTKAKIPTTSSEVLIKECIWVFFNFLIVFSFSKNEDV